MIEYDSRNKVSCLFPLGIGKRQCKLLNYKEGEIGAFLHWFIVIKAVRHEDMLIGLDILQSAWSKD